MFCVQGMTQVSGATEGNCCVNQNACDPTLATKCNVASITNSCTGATIKCGITCGAGQHCTGTNGTCVSDNNCSNIGTVMSLPNPTQQRGGADGNPCNDTSDFYQKTGGGFFNCVCTQHTNSYCDNPGTTADEGSCACNKLSCSPNGSCRQNGQADGCGGTQSCPCPKPGDVCLSNGNCCTPLNQCNNPPSGIPVGSCNYGDGCGGSVGLQCCPTTNMTTGLPIEAGATSCVPHAGASPAYGDCVCTPTHKCTDPGIHDGDNDGCGNALRCQN
jgi:hypothetical protein